MGVFKIEPGRLLTHPRHNGVFPVGPESADSPPPRWGSYWALESVDPLPAMMGVFTIEPLCLLTCPRHNGGLSIPSYC